MKHNSNKKNSNDFDDLIIWLLMCINKKIFLFILFIQMLAIK